MGCISSKLLMSRSLSYREELTHKNSSSKGNDYGRPVLEDLFIAPNGSGNGRDQLLSLFSAANKLSKQTSTLQQHSSTDEPTTPEEETINAWELMAGLEEEEQEQELPADYHERIASTLVSKDRLSKSCRWENEELLVYKSYTNELFHSDNGNEFDLGNRGVVRSRSFHTVEEYDALVERIWMSTTNTRVEKAEHLEVACLSEESSYSIISSSSSTTTNVEESEGLNNSKEEEMKRGLKRKNVREGLAGSLKIPPPPTTTSNIEFTSVGSLRHWLNVNSPSPEGGSNYETPKFGSYNNKNNNVKVKVAEEREEEEEGMIVDPELVAAFEECMQRLEMEQDSLIQNLP